MGHIQIDMSDLCITFKGHQDLLARLHEINGLDRSGTTFGKPYEEVCAENNNQFEYHVPVV